MDQSEFSGASEAWMKNKIRKGAMIYYKCEAIQHNGLGCSRKASQDEKYKELDKHYCSQHAHVEARKQQM